MFLLAPASALTLKWKSPVSDVEWFLETTLGFQNTSDFLFSKEGGTKSDTRSLSFAGVLFHSKAYGVNFSKIALNIGLKKIPFHFWTDSVYRLEDTYFSEDVHCLEVDAQFKMPLEFSYWYYIHPFIGYSFIDYTYDDIVQGGSQNRFNTFVVGLQTNIRFGKRINTNYFISYSPFLYSNYEKIFYRYLYYGGELIIDSHPVAFTFCISIRKAFKKNRDYFNILHYGDSTMFDMLDLGMSFHINLR